MVKSAFVLALLGTATACTAPQPAAVGSASASAQTKRVCTDVPEETTGSLASTYQVCKDVPVDETGATEAQPQSQN